MARPRTTAADDLTSSATAEGGMEPQAQPNRDAVVVPLLARRAAPWRPTAAGAHPGGGSSRYGSRSRTDSCTSFSNADAGAGIGPAVGAGDDPQG